jgi:hypothetical protein
MGLSRLNGPIYEDLTFATGKGITFGSNATEINDTGLTLGNGTTQYGLLKASNVGFLCRNAGDTAYVPVYANGMKSYGDIEMADTKAIKTGTAASDEFSLQGYDANGTAYVTVIRIMGGINEPYARFDSPAMFNQWAMITDGIPVYTGCVSRRPVQRAGVPQPRQQP